MAGFLNSARDVARFLRVGGRFGSYLRARRAAFVASISLTVLFAAVRLLEPWPLQILLDQVVLGRPSQLPRGFDPLAWAGDVNRLLLVAALAILVLAIVSGALYYAQSILVAKIGQQVIRDIREDVYHHMLRHSLAFHRRNDPGDLIMRLTGDMMFLREMLLAVMVTMTGEWIVLGSTLALMIWVSPKLTLVTLVITPALVLLFYFFRLRMREAARKQRKREGKIAGQIGEALLAIPMIQSFTAEQQEDERFRKICKRSEKIGVRSAKLEAGMQRLVEILIAVGTCLVMWFGIREILADKLTPGVFLVFLAYLRALFKPIRKLGKVAERTARASAAAERILEVLETRRDVKDSKKARPAPSLAGAVEFADVGFTYENGSVALKDFTARIEAGEQVVVTGHSGAGKSTLVSLLLGFNRPTRGKVLLDGTRLKLFTLKTVRRQIAYLPQEPFLVGGTLRENLLYGDPLADDEAMWVALDQAELGEFVRSLPKGLDTSIPSRGQSLSGGQKQRLAIARALLKDAPILLLDEPTVGLDPATEESVLRSLRRLRSGRTTITIAHRHETVRTADRVLELREGCLVRDERQPNATSHSFSPIGSNPGDRSPDPATLLAIVNVKADPALPGLVRLLGPKGEVSFRKVLEEYTEVATPIRIRARKQRLGQRALLYVEQGDFMRGASPSGRTGGRAPNLFVKLFRSRSSRPFERAATAARLAGAAGLEVPKILGWNDRFRALIMEEASGTSWWDLPAADRLSTVSSLARSLAQMHLADVPSGWTEVESEGSRLTRVRARAENRGCDDWLSLKEVWDKSVAGLLFEPTLELSPAAPIHGDVYPDQLLATRDTRVILLDWDVAGIGSPARDVGNFVAHLDLEILRGRLTEEEGAALSLAFLEPFARLGADVQWHRRSTHLRLAALYSDPGFGARSDLNSPGLAKKLLGATGAPLTSAAVNSPGEA